ncbi:MAG TPA: sulfite exporter TauE/SafE family protein [Candidatus Limnocylindrales bacterium]|nr:sulfite exporter TauE/SafE family protein [Candidatus Limnocylindrales bacterium]
MLEILLIAIVACLIGLSKGGMGAVLVVLTTPLLSQAFPVKSAISMTLPLLIIADVFALYAFWNKWDMAYVRAMLPAAVVGVVIGSVLLAVLPDLALRRIMGLFTLTFVIYRIAQTRIARLAYVSRPWHAPLAGGVSGLGSAMANTGAPPYTAYMMLQKVDPVAFAGTATLFFAIINALKMPGLVVSGIFDWQLFLATLWVVPLIPLLILAGRYMVMRINHRAFDRLMLALLAMASFILLFVTPR